MQQGCNGAFASKRNERDKMLFPMTQAIFRIYSGNSWDCFPGLGQRPWHHEGVPGGSRAGRDVRRKTPL